MNRFSRKHEHGATALFVVIFSIILLSTITISFMSIMINEQKRATNDDLSQSAYDSALAGVEDAKRVIMRSRDTTPEARRAQAAIRDSQSDCQAIGSHINGVSSGNETLIQSSAGVGADLNQSYTCVQVSALSNDYVVNLLDEQRILVPLNMVKEIETIKLQWHTKKDTPELDLPSYTLDTPLHRYQYWRNDKKIPAILRVQSITPDAEFNLEDFNKSETSSTVFLYPTSDSSEAVGQQAFGPRVGDLALANAPQRTKCNVGDNFRLMGGYACESHLKLVRPVPAQSKRSFLLVGAIYYNDVSLRVTAYDKNGELVKFDGAQPIVDSTGRANDVFRRVEARLSLGGASQLSSTRTTSVLPQEAVSLTGSLCKNFFVTKDGVGASGVNCSP